MKVTKRQLKRIIKEALSWDDFVQQGKTALQSDDYESFAALLVDRSGDDAHVALEDIRYEELDFTDIRSEIDWDDLEQVVYDEMDSRALDSVSSSPNQKELEALGTVFQNMVRDEDLKYITYQVLRRKGEESLRLEDNGELGDMLVMLNDSDATNFNTSIQSIIDVLNQGGATITKRRKQPKHVPPMYD